MSDEPSIPVYAVALSDAPDTVIPVGYSNTKTGAARIIRNHLRSEQGELDPDVPASAVVYARGGYWIDD